MALGLPYPRLRPQIERRHFLQIPDEQIPVGERGVVPRLALEHGEPHELFVFGRGRADEREIAVFA